MTMPSIAFPSNIAKKIESTRENVFRNGDISGFAASKKRYFCGIKVHMVVTNQGRPFEVHLCPGAESDVSVLGKMELDIPPDSFLYADGGYKCFDLEDQLLDERIQLLAKRGSKAKNRVRSPSAPISGKAILRQSHEIRAVCGSLHSRICAGGVLIEVPTATTQTSAKT